MREQKVRTSPRISVNGLAEYLVAGAARRRRIVQEQKRPKNYQAPYYTDAEEAIMDFLASSSRNVGVLDRAAARLSAVETESRLIEWELTRRMACTEALLAFRNLAEGGLFAGLSVTRAPQSQRLMQIGGVGVSVRPEILLSSTAEEPRLGGAKLFFSKNEPLTESRALYTGTILHQYLDTHQQRTGTVDYRHCLVVDVFAEKVYAAPRTYKRRRTDIEAACLEITLAWETA
jgi:hypothetical protein